MDSKTVTQAELQGIVNGLKARDARLITIVGVDTGENIEVIYFLPYGREPDGRIQGHRAQDGWQRGD
jgi:hypothetical protein